MDARIQANGYAQECQCGRVTTDLYWWDIWGKSRTKPLCERCHAIELRQIVYDDIYPKTAKQYTEC